MAWRWAAASKIGTSHLRRGTRKQDAYRCFLADPNSSVLCALVCDGAGSAAHGGEGASLIGRVMSVALRGHFQNTADLPSDDAVWSWIDHARDLLATAAEKRSVTRREFASTLVLLAVSDGEALTVQVGDGAIVARSRAGSWRALTWPETGEYASTTYFLTEDPAPRVRIARHPADFDAVALFSDGIETLALDFAAEVPHEPFFRSMIGPLDAAQTSGHVRNLSVALGKFLESPRVCERTDDDKSLIIASAR